ncbi:histone deacetylase family protein [Aminipila sp.]|uniref:histone deacetylase family protein n=1 Tax=Aminipila sp. TaxID=2060095 RepID=UPI002898359A|nr:hypothetical protein [Aminipila sp.]
MQILCAEELSRMHNPEFVYQLQGREPQKYPENIQRALHTDVEALSCNNLKIINLNTIHLQAEKLINFCCDKEYIDWLYKKAEGLGEKEFYCTENKSFLKDQITPITGDLPRSILVAISLGLNAVDKFIREEDFNFYICCRPPGHHAGRNFGGGFCYVNNVAISIEYLLMKKREYQRIGILDLDLHLGNGTIDFFKENNKVRYFSLHMEPSICYPFYNKIHQQQLYGNNVNIELKALDKGCSQDKYLKELDKLIEKIDFFQPELLFLSMGYDTHKDDPCRGFMLSSESYKLIAKKIYSHFGIPIISFHEGGYNYLQTQASFENFIQGAVECWQ